jgi:hypothetical protein
VYNGITIPVEDVAASAGCIVATNAMENNRDANIPATIVLDFASLKLLANNFLYYKRETDHRHESVFSF